MNVKPKFNTALIGWLPRARATYKTGTSSFQRHHVVFEDNPWVNAYLNVCIKPVRKCLVLVKSFQ